MACRLAAIAVLVLTFTTPALAHETEGKGKLGKVDFANSCSPAVQADLARAVAMLHSFWYSAGEQAFRDVLKKDPECAIATWGIASILMSNPLAGQGASPKGAEAAQAAIEQGRRIGAKTAARARLHRGGRRVLRRLREPLGARAAGGPREGLRGARGEVPAGRRGADLQRAVHRRHADAGGPDVRGVPQGCRDPREAVREVSRPSRRRALPDPQLRRAADRQARAWSPRAATRASRPTRRTRCTCRRTSSRASGRGRSRSRPTGARPQVADRGQRVRRGVSRERLRGLRAACSSRATTRRAARSTQAMKVQGVIANASSPTTRWRRCLPATRSSAARGAMRWQLQRPADASIRSSMRSRISPARWARRAAATSPPRKRKRSKLAALHKQLQDAKNNYWATEVEVQRLAAAGWIALAQKNKEDALKFMRAAADLEDKNEKHIVTPGRIVPARELLGDMLLELKPAGAGAEGIRGVAGARAQPLPRALRSRGGGGGRRRQVPRRRSTSRA